MSEPQNEHGLVRALRGALLAILLLGVVGTLAELYLLEHTEDVWQLLPLWLLGASLVVIALLFVVPGSSMMRLFQALTALSVVSGFVGIWLHYQGNAEFELEMYPSLAGVDLLRESLSGATPVLAPGTMMLLGLIGLVYSYRHPTLTRSKK